MENTQWPEFLIYFVHRLYDFRYPELEAVLRMHDIEIDISTLPDPSISPLLRLRLPSEHHAKLLSTRAILIKGVYQVWGHTATSNYTDLVKSVSECTHPDKLRMIQDVECSWCINVQAFGKKMDMQEQETKRNHFEHVLPFAGPVQMKEPDAKILLLEEYSLDLKPISPLQMYLLRELAGSERNRGRGGGRDLVDQQTLKRRAYIGPTSMESEMALLMANMGQVQNGDVVIDPFVGTGSVLIPCATHGAVCYGTDIDIRVLLGTGVGVSKEGVVKEEDVNGERVNVRSNFKQYGLPLPELIRADNSISPLLPRANEYFDAVVCDPPYGIRAGARKSGRKPGSTTGVVNGRKAQLTYIPPTQPYAAEEVMFDLLQFAAATLRIGGRLVYLLPTTYEYTDADLPKHAMLKVVANSEQKLTKKYARRLITMVKIEKQDDHEEVESIKTRGVVSFSNLREKIGSDSKKRKL